MPADRDSWFAACAASPDDFALLAVFGDWLEEHGDPLGPAVRWMCEHRRRPGCSQNGIHWSRWWKPGDVEAWVPQCVLPQPIYDALPSKGREVVEADVSDIVYPSWSAAVTDLAGALESLKAKEKEKVSS